MNDPKPWRDGGGALPPEVLQALPKPSHLTPSERRRGEHRLREAVGSEVIPLRGRRAKLQRPTSTLICGVVVSAAAAALLAWWVGAPSSPDVVSPEHLSTRIRPEILEASPESAPTTEPASAKIRFATQRAVAPEAAEPEQPRPAPRTQALGSEPQEAGEHARAVAPEAAEPEQPGAAPRAQELAGENQSSALALTSSAIREVVSRHRPSLRRCYEAAIRGMENPPGTRVDVSFTITPDGDVRNTEVRVSVARLEPQLTPCIKASVRDWRFPRSAGATPLTFPVVFSSGR